MKNPPDAVSSTGKVDFQETDQGIVNTDWTSNPPPPHLPDPLRVSCIVRQRLASTLLQRHLGLAEPGARRAAAEGRRVGRTPAARRTTSRARRCTSATRRSSVPAFPRPSSPPSRAADHAGRSARRSVRQRHAHDLVGLRRRAREGRVRPRRRRQRARDDVVLRVTNLTPLPTPSNIDYFPLGKGRTMTYRWTNTKHLQAHPRSDAYRSTRS